VYLAPGCEINLSGNATTAGQLPRNFGVRALVSPNPDTTRVYNIETTVGVQHELMPGFQVNAGWFHRTFHNLPRQTNTLQNFSDYTLVNVVSPLDGSLIPMYNVSAAKLTQINNVVATDDSQKEWYNGYEISFSARLPHGASLFGGTTIERMLWTLCNEQSNPNNLLYWEIIKRSCRRGETVLDFGRSPRGSSNLDFKLRWGAQELPQPFYMYAPKGEPPRMNARDPGVQRLVRLWQRLPRALADALGPTICRSFLA